MSFKIRFRKYVEEERIVRACEKCTLSDGTEGYAINNDEILPAQDVISVEELPEPYVTQTNGATPYWRK
jgi:hypothetical protein